MIASTSASPYLHPEQHTTHGDSTAAASGVSPLALLAQTCSAIGKDSSPKQLMPTLGRITGGCDDGGGCVARRPAGLGAPSAVAAGLVASAAGGGRSRATAASPERAPSADPPSSRSHESVSPAGAGHGRGMVRPHETGGERRKSLSPVEYGPGRPQSLTTSGAQRKQAARESRQVRNASSAAAAADASVPASYAAQALAAATQASLPFGLAYTSLYQHWLPYFGQLCAAEAMQQQQQLSRSQAEKAAYSAAAASAATLSHPSPVHGPCRDLGCLACRLSSHAQQLSPQQQHASMAAAAAAAAAANSTAAAAAAASVGEHYVPGCPCCVDKLRGAATSPLFAPPQLNAAAAAAFLAAVRPPPPSVAKAPPGNGLTYPCHWVSGTEYCGQLFASVDDLMQHVKTHASNDAAVASAQQRTSPLGLTPTPFATTYARAAAAALAAAAAVQPPPPSFRAGVAASHGVGLRPPQHAHSSARLHPYAKQYHGGGSGASGGGDAKLASVSVLPVDLSSNLSYLSSSSPYAALFGAGGVGSAASR